MKRRSFLEFLGKGTLAIALPSGLITACADNKAKEQVETVKQFVGIEPSSEDLLKLADGFDFQVLIKWDDQISETDRFGFNNDYTAFIPLEGKKDEGILWVNHEYTNGLFVSGVKHGEEKTKAQVEQEQYTVGGSLVHIKKEHGTWNVVQNSVYNRRITALTPIPFNWDEPIMGKKEGIGTLANCSGGITPWGTILTCEENYDMFYGERNYKTNELELSKYDMQWLAHANYPTEHYGWVVEVNPLTGEAQKHIALGRCAHECATIAPLADGRIAVYTGDDHNDECLYKFISSKPNSLKEGTLYVANTTDGRWESLDYASQPILQKHFKSQTEVLIRLREAARLVGGTLLDRPEDIEVDPLTGDVLVALTNNKPKGNYHGSILKISETEGNYESLTFTSDVFLAGGKETGFSCPDNMAFDLAGNLWFTSDISGSSIGKSHYKSFKNNGLFFVPRSGDQAGEVIQMASAPKDAEFTGPFFAPDGKTLFLSVQHPGETSKSLDRLTSNWPDGGDSMPRSAVVAISGSKLDEIQAVQNA
ncbi:MAG: PhoX family protein [Flammeovirgaceae bacterium]